jgi:transcriptional regulator with XRE-family HTH domain
MRTEQPRKVALAADEPYEPPSQRTILASAPSLFIPPPVSWRHPITGKRGWQPSFELIAFGTYVKRARYLARLTQVRLAESSGVDQGQISRLERALAPWTRTEDLVAIGTAIGRALPLGFCPHEHPCQWQPAPQPPVEKSWQEKWQEAEQRFSLGRDDSD